MNPSRAREGLSLQHGKLWQVSQTLRKPLKSIKKKQHPIDMFPLSRASRVGTAMRYLCQLASSVPPDSSYVTMKTTNMCVCVCLWESCAALKLWPIWLLCKLDLNKHVHENPNDKETRKWMKTDQHGRNMQMIANAIILASMGHESLGILLSAVRPRAALLWLWSLL